ncbi:MAG: class I SAM-dependent methyltransferase [Deltaproteobacteria bacterium]|nr:class I SAM-dependent methyltransferase [Deltaproteobacteria bacterium]
MDRQYLEAGATPDFFYFKAKNRLIEVLLSKVKQETRPKILDVGVGSGEELSVIKKFGEIYVAEPDLDLLRRIPEDLVVEKNNCELGAIQYPDHFFDWVLAFDVLEHIEDDRSAVLQILRVLKPGGFFVFTVPAFGFLFGAHDLALQHFRRYNKKMIRNLLVDFKSRELGCWVFFFFLPLALQRRLKRHSLNYQVHFMALPKAINRIFYSILIFESWLINKRIPLPVGTTLYGIYQKK